MSIRGMHRRDKKVLLKDLNSLLTCTLCNGYFIDATTFDCMHTFCRSCILNHFETTKQQTCPTCDKKKGTFKSDLMLQALVYKMVPGLFGKETQRRDDFYRSSVRASSTCSEDSLLGDLRPDQKWDQGDQVYLSPEDPISLSLEFYQCHLDDTDTKDTNRRLSAITKRPQSLSSKSVCSDTGAAKDGKDFTSEEKCEVKMKGDRRYLQCPAAVSMCHLQKFLRMKYALSAEHRVDIIYEGEVLPLSYTLIDVAYTFHWTKLKPMRFFYRIFTPLKVQPIKIINTLTSNGGKHLQIVPVRPNSDLAAAAEAESKEQFVAHLKLQSKHKTNTGTTSTSTLSTTTGTGTTTLLMNDEDNCIFEYEEPDKEEIKRFAESRDREWARMRYEDDGVTPASHHVKKRKKSKHSKGDVKKPKIHAEITSSDVTQQESIKLKVKLTPAHAHNGHGHGHSHGHKHKHRSQMDTAQNPVQSHPMSTQTEPKKVQSIKKLNDIIVKKADPKVKLQMESKKEKTPIAEKTTTQKQRQKEEEHQQQQQKTFLKTFPVSANQRHPTTKIPQTPEQKKPLNTYSNQTKKAVSQPHLQNVALKVPQDQSKVAPIQNLKVAPSQNAKVPPSQNLKASQSQNVKVSQGQNVKVSPSQNLKVSPSQNIKVSPNQNLRVSQNQAVKTPQSQNAKVSHNQNLKTPQSQSIKVSLDQNSLQDSKVRLPQQQTSIKPPPQQKVLNSGTPTSKASESKRVSFAAEKPHILNSQQYSAGAGFTVSKVEQGQKRKADADQSPTLEKRPCLEITLINPPPEPPKLKRPPPATIPLDRIKKAIAKPKISEGGALDLTKKLEPVKTNGISGVTTLNGIGIKTINGMKFPSTVTSPTSGAPQVEKIALSNLQMLSKVALQHSKQTNTTTNTTISTSTTPITSTPTTQKVRPQVPNLQTLRTPNLNPANNHRNVPKLTEINKSNLKLIQNQNHSLKAAQIRSAHGQSQSQNNMTRSIPNPAMLVRQHNQNRMNLNSAQNNNQADSQKKESQNNTQQPKILNPLAKENTDLAKDHNGPGTGSVTTGSVINSLMNKILDHGNKSQMIASSTVGTAT